MKIGVVGLGTMGRVHTEAYLRMGVKLVAAYDSDPEVLRNYSETYSIEPAADYEHLLQKVDVIDVCTPTFTHLDMAEIAFALDADVILEKPLALTVEDGEQIIRAARESGHRLFVGMVVRFFPQYRRAAELVRAGELGEVGVARFKRVGFPPAASWFHDPQKSGGMPVDLMIHDLDYARWLLGEPTSVFARRSPPLAGEALEHVQAVLSFASGAVALIEGGWAYPPGYFRTSFDIAGNKGLIEWSSDQPEPLRGLFPKDEPPLSLGLPMAGLEEDPYELELRHALAAIESGAPFEITPEDALAALKLALAVRQSAESGRVAEVA